MLRKLKSLGIDSTSVAWFHSYLFSRCQKAVIGQAISATRKVTVGVPRGSILGPISLTIYINGLSSVLQNGTVTLFIDDTAQYCFSNLASRLPSYLNHDLERLAQWLHGRKLTLNVTVHIKN